MLKVIFMHSALLAHQTFDESTVTYNQDTGTNIRNRQWVKRWKENA